MPDREAHGLGRGASGHLTLSVLLYASLAAAAASLGALPLLIWPRPPGALLGWANALAAGFMLGAAYLLMAAGLPHEALWGALGAALGIGYVFFVHATSRTGDLQHDTQDERNPLNPYKALLSHTLHAAPEGVAIGVAMVVSARFGVFMAAAIAVHNVPEAMALCSLLRGQGEAVGRVAWLAAATRTSQVLLAVSSYAVLTAAPVAVPWILGFAVGALVYLVMADLLPDSYAQAGTTSIALVTVLAMGIVVLLSPSLPR